jgi:hypothetical protein
MRSGWLDESNKQLHGMARGPGQATFHRTLVQTVQQQPQLLGVFEAPVERWLRVDYSHFGTFRVL